MKTYLKCGLVLGLFVLGAASAYATGSDPGLLYIVDDTGNLGTVNLNTDAVTVIGNAGVTLTDIAFTSNGNLYGTSVTHLYSVNQTTGAATNIAGYGAVGSGEITALAGDGSVLYAASGKTPDLYEINPSPFSITTLTGSTPHASAGDLAASVSLGGVMYDSLTNGELAELTISGNTFTTTDVGNMKVNGVGSSLGNVYGLAFGANGVLYAIADTEIYSVNLSNANLTPVFNYSGHGLAKDNGAASLVVPEPGSLPLLLAGLLGLALYRRRARA